MEIAEVIKEPVNMESGDVSPLNSTINIKSHLNFTAGNFVGAVVVTYQPSLSVLKTTIQSLINQVSHIYLVDNTQDGAVEIIETVLNELDCLNLVTTLILRDNLGLARAQNEGIKLAITDKCDFVMLSDQDTSYPPDCVNILLNGFRTLQQKGIKAAALSPAFINSHTPEVKPYFIRLTGFFVERIFTASGLVDSTQIIASGQFMPVTVFTDVGFMDEQLFIDWVDTEWCWRARSKGWKIYGCADVVISHTLGDHVKLLAGRAYSLRSPVRHYYIVRNAIILALHRDYIPWKYRVHVFFRGIRFLFGAPYFSRPHLTHFRHTFLGFVHGLMNRHGRF